MSAVDSKKQTDQYLPLDGIKVEPAPKPTGRPHSDLELAAPGRTSASGDELLPLRVILPSASSFLDAAEVARLVMVCKEFAQVLREDPRLGPDLKVFAQAWALQEAERLVEELSIRDGECRMFSIQALLMLGTIGAMSCSALTAAFGIIAAQSPAGAPNLEAVTHGFYGSVACLVPSAAAIATSLHALRQANIAHLNADAGLRNAQTNMGQTLQVAEDAIQQDEGIVPRELAKRLFNLVGQLGDRGDLLKAIESGNEASVDAGLSRVLASPLLTSGQKVSWLTGAFGTRNILPGFCYGRGASLDELDEGQLEAAVCAARHVAGSPHLSLGDRMRVFPSGLSLMDPPPAPPNLAGQTVLWLAVHESSVNRGELPLLLMAMSSAYPGGPRAIHETLIDAWTEVAQNAQTDARAAWAESIVDRLVEVMAQRLASMNAGPVFGR